MINKKINILDVGAYGDLDWPFNSLKKNDVNFIQIDPQFSEKEISDQKNKHKYILWETNEIVPMYIYNTKETSSVFKPNINFLKHFPEINRFKITKEEKVNSKSIDHLVAEKIISELDFVKLDTQGSEKKIINGGEKYLGNNLVGMQIEVEFEKIYENQPLFADIDIQIRNKLGLSLWDLDLRYFKYKEGVNKKTNFKGRVIYANALYMRSIENLENWLKQYDKEFKKNKLYALYKISFIYGYLDYCLALLNSSIFKDNYSELEINELRKNIQKNKFYIFPFLKNRYIYFVLRIFANHFKPSHNNWAHGNSILGNKKWFKYFFQI